MHFRRPWPLAALALIACQSSPEADRTNEPDVTAAVGNAETGKGDSAAGYSVPRILPGIRTQIAQVRAKGATKEDVGAFRAGVGGLVNAMEADLNRAGVTDTGYFGELGDSVLRSFGGGASDQPSLEPEDAGPVADQVERLIGMYEERMQAVR